jgi:dolichyl-phosphate beta-glucosyltransferase
MTGLHQRPGVSVVIPAYNEKHRLPRTLDALGRYCLGFDGDVELLVVDDGSSDGTAAVVRELAPTTPGLRVLERPHLGKGAAVRAGMLAARQPRVVLCDADLSMPAEQLDRFFEALDSGCPIAIGSRVLPESRRYLSPLRRRLMSWTFNRLVRILLVPGARDTQCGFKGFQRAVAHELFSRQHLNGFSFDVEILYLARSRGYGVVEVPIDWYFDADSRVRAGADSLKMALDLFRIRARALLRRYRHPIYNGLGERIAAPRKAPGPLRGAWLSLRGIFVALTHIALWFGMLALVLFGLFTAPIVMACAFLALYMLITFVRRSEAL